MRQRWTIWRLLCATNCIYPAQVGLCTIPCEIMLPGEHVQYLMYTIINRGRSDARKMASETGQETYEPHADPRTMPPGKLADHVGAVPLERHRSALEANWDMTARKYNQGRCSHE